MIVSAYRDLLMCLFAVFVCLSFSALIILLARFLQSLFDEAAGEFHNRLFINLFVDARRDDGIDPATGQESAPAAGLVVGLFFAFVIVLVLVVYAFSRFIGQLGGDENDLAQAMEVRSEFVAAVSVHIVSRSPVR